WFAKLGAGWHARTLPDTAAQGNAAIGAVGGATQAAERIARCWLSATKRPLGLGRSRVVHPPCWHRLPRISGCGLTFELTGKPQPLKAAVGFPVQRRVRRQHR